MEARNLYTRHSKSGKINVGVGKLHTLLLISLLLIGASAKAQTITYTATFTSGGATLAQYNAFNAWRASLLSSYVFSSFTISGSLDPVGLTCTDATVATNVAAALRNGTIISTSSNGHGWQVGTCGASPFGGTIVEFVADYGACSCNPGVGYSLRPGFGAWFGGVGSGSCTSTPQTITMSFQVQPIIFNNGSGQNLVVCRDAPAISINSLLTTTDGTGYTASWTLFTPPAHGTVVGLPTTAASGTNVSPTGVTFQPTPGYVGTDAFVVKVTDGNTTTSTTINVTVNPSPSVGAGSNVSYCPGGSSPLTASGATSYTWAPATGLNATTGATVTANPTSTTIYTITGTSASCSNTATVTVSVNPLPTIGAGPNVSTCLGTATSLTATGGTTYTWAPGTGLSATTGATVSANPAATTIYTINGTAAGCSNTGTITVSINPLPTIAGSPNTAICIGGSATLSASGGNTYSWAPNTGLSATTGASVTANPAATTNYTVTGTNGSGCSNKAFVNVTVNTLPAISGGSNVAICTGNSTTLTATGGITYSWSPSTGLSATTGASVTANPTTLTTYTVTGTNASGCTNTATVTVSVNPLPSVGAGSNVAICAGNNTTLTATGALIYSWSPATGLSATTGATVTAAPGNTTTYVVTGTSSLGCNNTSSVTVSVNALPVIGTTSGSGTSICAGSGTSITATGASTYSWSPATGLSATTGATVTANPSGNTNYTITGTSSLGCVNTGTIFVTVNALPSAISGTRVVCESGATTSLSDGSAGGTWTSSNANANVGSTTGVVTGVSAGTANIIYTLPIGCSVSAIVTVNPLPIIGAGANVTICSGTSTTLTATGGTSYSWSPATGLSSTTGSTVSAAPTATTTYVVTGMGANGCANTSNVTVSVNPLPAIGTTVGTGTTVCNGSTITLTATGGVSYSWLPATSLSATTGASVDANPTSDITYVVTGTDANGCINTANIAVTVNPLPAAIGGSLNFCLSNTVTLTNTSAGGMWTSSNLSIATVGSASGIVTGVATGVDTIVYTLPTGCLVWVSGTVNPISDFATVTDQTICSGASTTPVVFTGSVPGTVFEWSNSNSSIGLGSAGTGNIASFAAIDTSHAPLTATIMVMPVNNGCMGTMGSFNITVNPTPDVDPSLNQTLCEGLMTNPINFTGSVAGTIFTWTNSNTSIGLGASGTGNIAAFAANDTSTAALTSTITVNTSAAGCTGSSNSFTITIYPAPVLNSGLSPAGICDNTIFNYVPTSLTAGTSFSWSRSAVTGIANAANTGVNNPAETLDNNTTAAVSVTYVYAMEANGCVDTQNVVVNVNPTAVLSSTLTPAAVCDSVLFNYTPTSVTTGVLFSWTRASVLGISNPASSGTGISGEYLHNTTANPITVHYTESLNINGCINTQVVSVVVKPTPRLSTPHVLPQICSGTNFLYVPASLTAGTTFKWTRAAIGGNPVNNGADTISELLVNTGTSSIVVMYADTLKANGCMNTEMISVRVMPHPVLTSSLTPPGLCDSAIFNYAPTSATPGTNFTWVRPFVLGIGSAAGTGAGNPNEQLINTTNDNLDVTYIYTLDDSGCTNVQNVKVTVHPTPLLSSNLTPSVCSGSTFGYALTSFTFGTTFVWNRAKVAGISPSTGTGTGPAISETLTDSLLVPLTTKYDVTLTANGCSHHQLFTLTVNPAPTAGIITTHPEASLCNNTQYQNFGAATLPPAGQTYTWSAQNAEVIAQGAGHQYCLVSFNNSGAAVVALTAHIDGYSCITPQYFAVNIGNTVSAKPDVIYFNGQFVCTQYDFKHYQWGYDDAITLDSTLLEGEVNPNYFNNAPDTKYKHYWVMTTEENGCTQKSYFNVPTGITEINSASAGEIKVFPNPASEMLNVEINSVANGTFDLEIVNMLGQKLQTTHTSDRKAEMNVSALPAGNYLVVCYRNGVKMTAVRFVKN